MDYPEVLRLRVGMPDKAKLKQVVLWVMAADFPLMYIGAVSLENAVFTAVTLAVMAVAVAVAVYAY